MTLSSPVTSQRSFRPDIEDHLQYYGIVQVCNSSSEVKLTSLDIFINCRLSNPENLTQAYKGNSREDGKSPEKLDWLSTITTKCQCAKFCDSVWVAHKK